MNIEVLPHDFFKLQTPKFLGHSVHFWANVMLRQPPVRASRASPSKK